MTKPHLKLFSDTESTSAVVKETFADLDLTDPQWLPDSSAPVVSIAGLEAKVKQQINQILLDF